MATDFEGDIRRLLTPKPADFDKDWATFLLSLRTAEKQESFLSRMAGLATTLTAIIGVVTGIFTAVQLMQKQNSDKEDATRKYQFDALSLYTSHWNDFNSVQNCPHFTAFAKTIVDKAPDLSAAVSADWQKLCLPTAGNAQANADQKEGEVAANSLYATTQQVTPTQVANAPPASDLASLTVYVQYRSDKEEAAKVRSLVAGAGANAPALEAVANVPATNQIRIYKEAQRPLAQRLGKAITDQLSLPFTIVNLERSYPNLPPNVVEVWLSQ